MAPEAEVAFEQTLGVDPATLTAEEEDVEDPVRIKGDALYQERLQRGAATYWLLIEAKVLDQRSSLTFWQLSAFEQQPYIKLGELMRANNSAAVAAARADAEEMYEINSVMEHGARPRELAEMLKTARTVRNRAVEKNGELLKRVHELEVALGLREGNATLDELTQQVEQD